MTVNVISDYRFFAFENLYAAAFATRRIIPMSADQDIPKALLSLYDAAYLEADWVRALDAVCSLSHAKGALLYAFDTTDDLALSTQFFNSHFSDKRSILEEYDRLFVSNPETSWDAEGIALTSRKAPFTAILDTDMWSLDHLWNVPEIQYGRKHGGIFRRLCFNLSPNPELQAGLFLQYVNNIEPPHIDVERLPQIMPHVGKAIEMFRFFSPLQQRYNAILSVLNQLNLGVCVLDRKGRLVVANTFANDLLHQRNGIKISADGHIRCLGEDEATAFEAAWQRIAQTAEGQNINSEVRLSVTRRGYSDPLLVIVSPLRDAKGEIDPKLSGAMVTFVDTSRVPATDMQGFARAYRLTKAEVEVASLMRDGQSATDIAEHRNVSPQTTATQIKSVLAKVGVHSRVQFVWRIFQFSPPITQVENPKI